MADEVHIRFMAPQMSTAEVRPLIEGLEKEPLCAPTYASVDERKRVPFDREAAIRIASEDPLILWRTKAPKYESYLTSVKRWKNGLRMMYQGNPSDAVLPGLFDAASRLSQLMRVEFGFVHLLWRLGAESQAYNTGITMNGQDLNRFGLAGVYGRTWFGPYLTSHIGKERLLSLPNTTETPWGGVQLDLLPQPWLRTFETLNARREEVMAQLRPTGIFGTFEGPSMRWKPDPLWVPPPWEKVR